MRMLLSLKKFIGNMKISTRIIAFNLFVFILSIIVSTTLNQNLFSRIYYTRISELFIQTLVSISDNIEGLISSARNISLVIMSNEEIQKILRMQKPKYDFDEINRLEKLLYSFVEVLPTISSIYIYDNNENYFYAGKKLMHDFKSSNIEKADWYKEVVALNGGFILKLNSDVYKVNRLDDQFISLISVVKDIASMEQKGVIIINFKENALKNSYINLIEKYNMDISIFDEKGREIVNCSDNKYYNMIDTQFVKDNGTIVKDVNEERYLISFLTNDAFRWKISSIIPFKEITSENYFFKVVTLIIIVINSIILFGQVSTFRSLIKN
jgi:two-component system, sensor histidine kinase YesM